jgi:septum site-determining protein MinD
MGEVFVILSGKGGVGKTTSAVNLGSSLNSLGKEVIIVDANLSTPNLGLHLGSPITPVTINHVILRKAKPEQAIYEHESGTKIMPASLSLDDLKQINYNRLVDITKRLKKISDHVILDSSAGLGEEAKAAIKASDKILIIVNPEMASITDALKAIKLAESLKRPVHGCIVTRHTGDKIEIDLATIKDMLEVPILGVIPEDRAIRISHKKQRPVIYTHPRSKAAKAYHKATKRILGPEYLKDQAQETQSLFKRFLNKLGFK